MKFARVRFFYAWLNTEQLLKPILEISPEIFRRYFLHINSLDLRAIVKRKYKGAVKDFIYWLITPKMARNEPINLNYEIIFSKRFVTISEGGHVHDSDALKKDDVLDCLQFFRVRNERDYVLFSLLAYCGMRVQGACNIKLTNIDWEKRKITTQEKRTSRSAGENHYAIPQSFLRTFKGYCVQQQTLCPNEPSIFPISTKTVRKQLKLWRKSAYPHQFRDALNSRWREGGLDEAARAILLNQVPSGVNAQHYLKELKEWPVRLGLYDQFFPY